MKETEKMHRYLEKRTNLQIEAAIRKKEKDDAALKAREMENRLVS